MTSTPHTSRSGAFLLALSLLSTVAALAVSVLAPDAWAELLTLLGTSGAMLGGCAGTTLAAALADCDFCPTRPPPRDPAVLVDRVDATDVSLGKTYSVKVKGAGPDVDSSGRIAHVRGIYFRAKANITRGATNVAYSARMLRALWQNLLLQDAAGHTYWGGTWDGRTILDDQFLRHGAMLNYPSHLRFGVQGVTDPVQTDNGIAVNEGAGTTNYDASLYCPLTRATGHELAGLIPLKLLTAKGAEALKFTVRSTLAGTATGLTFNKFVRFDGTDGVDVFFDIVWLSVDDSAALVIDAPWTIDNYTLNERQGALYHEDRTHEYVAIRMNEEDAPQGATAGFAGAYDHDIITLRVGGQPVLSGAKKDDVAFRMRAFLGSMMGSAQASNNATLDLPVIDPTANVPALALLLPFQPRAMAPAGRVSYEYGTRPGAWTRYIHRTVACHSPQRAKVIESIMRCGVCDIIPTSGGQVAGRPKSNEPVVVKMGKLH